MKERRGKKERKKRKESKKGVAAALLPLFPLSFELRHVFPLSFRSLALLLLSIVFVVEKYARRFSLESIFFFSLSLSRASERRRKQISRRKEKSRERKKEKERKKGKKKVSSASSQLALLCAGHVGRQLGKQALPYKANNVSSQTG